MFKLVAESAVAAGIRRIEAITGHAAMQYYKDKAAQLEQIETLLKKPADIVKAIEELQQKNTALGKEIEKFAKLQAQALKNALKNEVQTQDGLHFLFKEIQTDAASAKDILFQLRQEFSPFLGVLAHPEAPVQDSKLLAQIPEGIEVLKLPIWEPTQLYMRLSGHKGKQLQTGFMQEGKRSQAFYNALHFMYGLIFLFQMPKWLGLSLQAVTSSTTSKPMK